MIIWKYIFFFFSFFNFSYIFFKYFPFFSKFHTISQCPPQYISHKVHHCSSSASESSSPGLCAGLEAAEVPGVLIRIGRLSERWHGQPRTAVAREALKAGVPSRSGSLPGAGGPWVSHAPLTEAAGAPYCWNADGWPDWTDWLGHCGTGNCCCCWPGNCCCWPGNFCCWPGNCWPVSCHMNRSQIFGWISTMLAAIQLPKACLGAVVAAAAPRHVWDPRQHRLALLRPLLQDMQQLPIIRLLARLAPFLVLLRVPSPRGGGDCGGGSGGSGGGGGGGGRLSGGKFQAPFRLTALVDNLSCSYCWACCLDRTLDLDRQKLTKIIS